MKNPMPPSVPPTRLITTAAVVVYPRSSTSRSVENANPTAENALARRTANAEIQNTLANRLFSRRINGWATGSSTISKIGLSCSERNRNGTMTRPRADSVNTSLHPSDRSARGSTSSPIPAPKLPPAP